jgi:hypothetical protein
MELAVRMRDLKLERDTRTFRGIALKELGDFAVDRSDDPWTSNSIRPRYGKLKFIPCSNSTRAVPNHPVASPQQHNLVLIIRTHIALVVHKFIR